METEIIVVHRWASFQGLRRFIREQKEGGREYKLTDRREVHVYLVTADGEGKVYKSPTFNLEIAKKWAAEKHPGCRIMFTKRKGEWQYDEEQATSQWQAPQPNPLHTRPYRQRTFLVVTKRPMESAVIEKWTDLSLEAKQKFVGGRIDIDVATAGPNEEWDILFNEEGLADPDLLPNLKRIYEGEVYSILVGPVLARKVDKDGCEVSLTIAEAQRAVNLLNRLAVKPHEFSSYVSALSQHR